jgi:nucleoside-diphosphate-sugar epimerase
MPEASGRAAPRGQVVAATLEAFDPRWLAGLAGNSSSRIADEERGERIARPAADEQEPLRRATISRTLRDSMSVPVIAVAGATGNLGGRIVRALAERGAETRALVRPGAAADKLEKLRQLGAAVVEVDWSDVSRLAAACAGASCVVSALQGLRDVIVGVQARLLEAAVRAGVPRFIPSDFSLDFTKLPPGENRNFDLRREFHRHLEQAAISATSVFNGAFAELLVGPMPLILFRYRLVLYWGDPDQPLDFTTAEDTAVFTACAALDPHAPRYLRIAGDEPSARRLAELAGQVTGREFKLRRAGSLETLNRLIKILRRLAPGRNQLYPIWQQMQYMRDMFDGRAKLEPLGNDRYPGIRWTTVRDLLRAQRAL